LLRGVRDFKEVIYPLHNKYGGERVRVRKKKIAEENKCVFQSYDTVCFLIILCYGSVCVLVMAKKAPEYQVLKSWRG
jgi:hypothetical protein